MAESTNITTVQSILTNTAKNILSNLTADISNLTNLINSTNEGNIDMVSLPKNILLGPGLPNNQTEETKIGTTTIVIIVSIIAFISLILCLLWVCCCTKKGGSKRSSRRSKK